MVPCCVEREAKADRAGEGRRDGGRDQGERDATTAYYVRAREHSRSLCVMFPLGVGERAYCKSERDAVTRQRCFDVELQRV
jgi:hypothetical protein